LLPLLTPHLESFLFTGAITFIDHCVSAHLEASLPELMLNLLAIVEIKEEADKKRGLGRLKCPFKALRL